MDASLEFNILLDLFEKRKEEIENSNQQKKLANLVAQIEATLVIAFKEIVIKGDKIYSDAIPVLIADREPIFPHGEVKVRDRIIIAQDHALYRQLLCIRLALAREDEVFPILDHQQSIFDRTILHLPEDKSYKDFIRDEIIDILEIFLPAAQAKIDLLVQKWCEGNIQLEFNFTENGRFTSQQIKQELKEALLSISKDNEADWVDRLFEGKLYITVTIRCKPSELAELFSRLKRYKVIINSPDEKIAEFLSLHFYALPQGGSITRIKEKYALKYLEKKCVRTPLFTEILPRKKVIVSSEL